MSGMSADIFFEVVLNHAKDTERLGFELASRIERQALIVLSGPLGAGKTTFAQGAGKALGVEEPINSPTFTTINEYSSGRFPLYHFDLYRFHQAVTTGGAHHEATLADVESELDELLAAPGLVLIEWPQPLSYFIAQREHVSVSLNYLKLEHAGNDGPASGNGTGRVACVAAVGKQASKIVESVRNIYFS